MARKLRLEYAGAVYHVLSRGNQGNRIFRDDADRQRFLDSLGEACAKTGWQVHAWVLLSNHFHLIVETPQPNLVAGMKWLLGAYTARFNRRHKVFGHLFAGRYKSLLVDGSGNGYLKSVCDYVHLNPVRARLIKAGQPLSAFAWSSWPAYLLPPSKRPSWLRVDRLLGEHGIPKDSPAGRRELEKALEARRACEGGLGIKAIRRGWCLGGETFRRELLERMTERVGAEHYGSERAEAMEARAERIVREGLAQLGWGEPDLETHLKGHPAKLALAVRLRAETTMTVAWIVRRLRMGTPAYLNLLLYRQRRSEA